MPRKTTSDSHRGGRAPRHVLPAVIGIGLVAFLLVRYAGEWGRAFSLVRTAQPGFVAAAVASQILYYVFAGLLLRQCLRLVDDRPPFLWTLRATFLLILCSRILPGPGAAGPAVLYFLLERRGVKRTRSALVGPLFFAADYAVFLTVLAGSAVWLGLRTDSPLPPTLVAALLALILALAATAVWVLRRPERMEPLLGLLVRSANRVMAGLRLSGRLPESLPGELARTAREMIARWQDHRYLRWKLAFAAMMMPLCDAATMGCAFASFGFWLPVPSVLLGYGIATLGSIISLLPGGLGTFDAAMVLGFDGLGAPPAVTLAATILYRAIATLLPAAVGVPAFRMLVRRRRDTPIGDSPPSLAQNE